jgi:membrane protease YdiL (CAAX protease family)
MGKPAGGFLLFLSVEVLLFYAVVQWARSRRFRLGQTGGRPRRTQARSWLVWQLLLVASIAATYHEGDWTLSSVGLESEWGWLPSAILGAAAYIPLLVFIVSAYRLARQRDALPLAALQVIRGSWPSRRIEKLFFLLALLLNPFTEEFVFRGIIVHQLGTDILPLPVAAGLGLALFLLAHLYQGGQAIPFHTAFFGTTIILLYSPLGLAGCIGFHIVGDFYPWAFFFLALRRRDRNALRWKPRPNSASHSSGVAERDS